MRLVGSRYMRLAPSCELLQAQPASTHTHTLAPLINMEAGAE
jgi:hypothetical protein